ncbi:MAG TPA: glycosyltransferase family 2 protein [Dehalococcoidia bacterium]|nr:glycosyltransferase family 2 protein [Dehalococcoidia bacterium]
MFDNITPVILTLNEEANLSRTLSKLSWAKDIVIVDSYSCDSTIQIATGHPNVRVFKREFDDHASQWQYAITETNIATDWVLALDADYVLTDEFVDELGELDSMTHNGFKTRFRYCIEGKALRGSLYPSVTTLYKHSEARYLKEGHTQRVMVEGKIGELSSYINHDDRKPFSSWLMAQNKYSDLEAMHIVEMPWLGLRFSQKVRLLILVAPIAVLFYCLFVRACIFDGKAGIIYSLERVIAESILSIKVLKCWLSKK